MSEDGSLLARRPGLRTETGSAPLDRLLQRFDRLSSLQEAVLLASLLASPVVLHLGMRLVGFSQAARLLAVVLWVCAEALLYAIKSLAWILQRDQGSPQVREVGDAIAEGCEGGFKAQYKKSAGMALVFAGLLFASYSLNPTSRQDSESRAGVGRVGLGVFLAGSFLLGAACSAASGYAGVWVLVRANVRVAAACTRCRNSAIQLAFRAGYVAAAINTALAVGGITALVLCLHGCTHLTAGNSGDLHRIAQLCVGFCFGASFAGLFAQLGGDILSKAPGLGADLLGQAGQALQADRNPAVIAQLVGDCAGQSADRFESSLG